MSTDTICPGETGYTRLSAGLQPLQREWDGLLSSFDWLKKRLTPLDDAPRHDTMLDESSLSRVYEYTYPGRAVADVSRALKLSIEQMEGAMDNSLRGMFSGELKVQLEDRLVRHIGEGRALLDLFITVGNERRRANQPFAIRQHFLSGILLRLNPFLAEFQSVRKAADTEKDVEPQLKQFLLALEGRLFRLRAEIRRCRDNPSQKLAKKTTAWHKEWQSIAEEALRAKHRVMHAVLRSGVTYRGRCNNITFMWLPSMESADPWNFNPQAHMDAHFSVGHSQMLRENSC